VRNTVGFDWHPATHQLWFTDNGRDMLGDDIPPDELNCAPQAGLHFGFPFRYGNNLPDPDQGSKAPARKTFTPPRFGFPAHVATLGMRFYTGNQFPADYKDCVFVAQHGSWNRSVPQGYQVACVRFQPDGTCKATPFLEGFLDAKSHKYWGRPVDVQPLSDGSLLISDDEGGRIYRVTYR